MSPVFPVAASSTDAILLSLLSPSERADAQMVADFCRARLDLNAAAQSDGTRPAYAHLPLCVIDAVWSLSVRYESVRNVVSRYVAHASLGGQNNGDAHTVADFVQAVEKVGVDNFAAQVLQNKQRTASKSGILKADAVHRFALVLQEHGAQTIGDVPEKLRGNARFEQAILSIPGQGSGLSLRYFYMVCGASDLTKPDRMVFRFLQAALNRSIGGASEAQSLLTNASLLLRADFPNLSPRSLDNAIWKFEREKAGNENTTGGASDAKVSDAKAEPEPSASIAAPAETAPVSVAPVLPAVSEAAQIPDEETPREAAPVVQAPQSDTTPETNGEATAKTEETGENESEAIASYRVRLRELPADDRPRERLLQYGADVLSLGELLAILLRSGTQQQNVVELANHLLSHYGGLRGVAALTAHELAQINGIGPAKAAQIKAAIEFGRRLVASSPEERTKISSPRDVYHQVGPALRDEKREHFIALLLDTKNGLLRQITVSVGDLSSSLVHPREVFTPAVRYSAASIIVSHNHPSGDPTPSPEDVQVTARLVEAGELLGITLLDHIIVGDARWVSLKEKGLM